ncbi:hypothetical protein [Kitasatospora viridis]|uniref:Uncharacterized protein n=2 Tax=Actinomycetes TaxID=1760 RepID=A0A561UIA5_9ACTN|nr:hypothetical protein [Kitasatospora viridis]TWF99102.1 hypothetical protein FHX73_112938 [Kitasatospora viridis]
MTSDDAAQPCPMPNAHRRLMDCHAQWHRLHEVYFDPHEFRLTLNSLVPNLRNVTWLLQKQKAQLAGFEEWYPRFQQNSGSSEIMRWVVKSRNRITKEADLELLSELQVIWHQDWLKRTIGTSSKYPPRMSIREIVSEVMRIYRPPFGTMTVKRRWVDRALPTWELLDATSEAYSRLEGLLAEGHSVAGVPVCDLEAHDRECVTSALRASGTRLRCMLDAKDDLEANFDLVDGVEIESTSLTIERDEDLLAESVERYGGRLILPAGDPISAVPGFMASARLLMEKDGQHATFTFLYRGDALLHMGGLIFDSQSSKILAFEKLASEMKAANADGILVIAESWFALPTERERELETIFFPARDRLDRKEALTVYAATRDGRTAGMISMVMRDDAGRAICAEPVEMDDPVANTLAPILRMWAEMDSTTD